MKPRYKNLIEALIGAVFSIMAANLINDSYLLKDFTFSKVGLSNILPIILLILIALLFYIRVFLERVPIAYNVAIVGFPRSGKTTLMASLFDEIFSKRIHGVSAKLETESTINRVNEAVSKLKKLEALGPTKDQDIFAFRTSITLKKNFFTLKYKVEFGDFAGEDSETYIKDYGHWLHTTPFFKWIVSADAIIFVIDISQYLDEGKNEYVADISASVRAAWQHLISTRDSSESFFRKMPIILTFTKADLLIYKENQLVEKGHVPSMKDIEVNNDSKERLLFMEENVINDFQDLINYFSGETKNFKFIFTSAFVRQNKSRIGMEELLKAVLPKNNTPFFN